MTTTASPIFRSHHATPPDVPSPLYRALLQEWADLHQRASTTATLARWARAEPVLAGHTTPGAIIDAIDTAPRALKDDLMTALVRLAQTGHQLAGRIVLQAMLPKLVRITRQTAGGDRDNTWSEDRRHIVIAEFWDVLAHYPLHRRNSSVAAGLALDTLHRVTAPTRAPGPPLPLDPHDLPPTTTQPHRDVPDLDQTPTLDSDLAQLITWATTEEVITADDGQLLHLIYLSGIPAPYQIATARLHITAATARKRVSRARQTLIRAVRDHLELQDPATGAA